MSQTGRWVAVVALLGVAAWMMRGLFEGPQVNLGPYRALGTVAAGEAAAMIGGQGRLVLVVSDPGADGDPVQAGQVAAFRKALAAAPGVELKAVEEIALDPVTRMQTGGAIPPDRLIALVGKHTDAAGLVLFMPFPPVIPAELAGAGASAMKVMVVSALLPGYEAMLKSGALRVAIVPRPAETEVPAAAAAAHDPTGVRAEFDREYLVLRPP